MRRKGRSIGIKLARSVDSSNQNKRIVELDYLRVIAIFLMVTFHFVYDLNQFAGLDVDYESGTWYVVGKSAALLFIFVSGISSCLGKKTVKRGLIVLGFGLLITVATYAFSPDDYIRFGILHFLGISMLVSTILRKLGKLELMIIAVLAAVLGFWASSVTLDTFLLIPFGFMYNGFVSMDYYPVFPYISVFIIGIVVYKAWYQKGKRMIDSSHSVRWINFLSRHSLLIYMIHQPILVGLIYLVKLGCKI